MRQIDEIYIHCSDTRPEWMAETNAWAKRDEIDRWHRIKGWAGFGYHYLIDRDGTVVKGRSEARVGAHVYGHNKRSLGICLVGGHGCHAYDAFSQHFTADQDRAVRRLLGDLQSRYPDARIRGHNEVAARACPGFQVAGWLGSAGRGPAAAPTPSLTGLIARLLRGSA